MLGACACALLTACAPEPAGDGPSAPSALVDLEPEVRFDGPVLVVPGTRWDVPAESGLWRFRTFAKVLCLVEEPTGDALTLTFRPEVATAGFDFRLLWDGEELGPESVRRDAGELALTVDPARLGRGRHELTLVRRHPRGAFRKARHDNLFHAIGYAYGERRESLGPERAERLGLVAQFLQHGVLGRGVERRSGLVFVGAGRHRQALDGVAASLEVEPENFSSRPAHFRLASGGREARAEVEPGGRGRLELALAPDAEELVFEVEGEDEGPYLWGVPILERKAPEALAPIVLVTLDTTRRDALGAYGGRAGVTPVLDELAQRATVLEEAFSTSPWTLPSHASIFTGLYPSRHKAGVSEVQLPPGSATLARLLRRRGYLTAGISAGELSSSRFGLGQGFHLYRNPDQFETPGDRVTAYAEEILARHAGRPLFLFVNYFDPHAVYRAPERFEESLGVAALAAEVAELPVWKKLVAGDMSAWRAAVEGEAPITPAVRAYLEAAYLAEVAYTDHLLGRLFARLEALGLFERALVVVTADHGELLGEGGYVSHGARLDPELVEIPLIVKWPGQTRGARRDGLTSLVDLYPTILRAAGVEPPSSDGQPLAAEDGDVDARRSFVLLEEHEFLVHPLPPYMKVARHLFGVQRPRFRQLVWDAGESCARRNGGPWQPVPCRGEREQVLRSIEAHLDADGGAGLDEAAVGAEGAVSDEMRQSLEALGYL